MAKQQDQNLGCIVVAMLVVGFVAGRATAPTPVTPTPDAPVPIATTAAQPIFAAPDPAVTPSSPIDAEPAAEPTATDEAPARAERAVYYANCSAARAAGAAPIRIGEPGYAPHLDRDGDGVACE